MTKITYNKICDYIKNIIAGTIYENHVYSVGGCNRDIIMGNDPHDIDICIDIMDGGIKFADFLYNSGHLKNEPVLYPTYGTSSFILKEFPDITIEAVMTRKEQYKNADSRNPETVFGNIAEDAIRRDLTINSIYYNISLNYFYDPNNGIDDIKNKIIRTPQNPEIIFDDDPLRILRVIRFALKYSDFTIPVSLSNTIIKKRNRLSILKQERITDEINKIFQLHDISFETIYGKLMQYNLIEYIFPEISSVFYTSPLSSYIDDWKGKMYNMPISYYYAILFSLANNYIFISDNYNISQDVIDLVHSTLKRMKYPNKIISETVQYINIWNHIVNDLIQRHQHCKFSYIIRKIQYYSKNKLEIPNVLEYIYNMMDLLLNNPILITEFKKKYSKYSVIHSNEEIILCITGNDIKNYFNLPPSPLIKKYLNIAIDLILKNPELNSQHILLKKLKEIIMEENKSKMPNIAYNMRFEDIVWRKQYIKFNEYNKDN